MFWPRNVNLVHANKVSVPVREKSVHELNVCEKLVHELNACEIPVHKLDICEIPVHAIPVLPENSHAERSIVQNEFRMLVSEPIDNSFAKFRFNTLLPRPEPQTVPFSQIYLQL
jgi:hypothetical protein